MISRIRNSFAKALNDRVRLPRFIVIILNRDLIDYLNYDNYGLSGMVGPWIEWLAAEFNKLINDQKNCLPKKAVREDYPQLYWCNNPCHMDFIDNNPRIKLDAVMESVMNLYSNMRVIKLKECWRPNDSKLVTNNRCTSFGLTTHWKAIDAATRFNVKKHEDFITTRNYFRLKGRDKPKPKKRPLSQEDLTADGNKQRDLVPGIFNRFNQEQKSGSGRPKQFDRFHWCNNKKPKFALPRVKNNKK